MKYPNETLQNYGFQNEESPYQHILSNGEEITLTTCIETKCVHCGKKYKKNQLKHMMNHFWKKHK